MENKNIKVNKVNKKEPIPSKKLDRLENLRGMLLSVAFTMSDLIDEITGYDR